MTSTLAQRRANTELVKKIRDLVQKRKYCHLELERRLNGDELASLITQLDETLSQGRSWWPGDWCHKNNSCWLDDDD